jgi:cytochrome c peroxidase
MHAAIRLVPFTLLTALVLNCEYASASEFPLAEITPAGTHLELTPTTGAIVVGEPGTWILRLTDPAGDPVTPLLVTLEGGMRAHGHGFPEAVAVQPTDEPGRYEIAPVIFNMPGDWQILVRLGSPQSVEQVRFELTVGPSYSRMAVEGFTDTQKSIIDSLRLDRLPAARDPSNRFSGNPSAVALGRRLFFADGLSSSREKSCAHCHQPEQAFTDGKAVSVPDNPMSRNAPTLLGVGLQRWYYWDGRRDSLWAQALTPMETRAEMGSSRMEVVRFVTSDIQISTDFRRLTHITTRFEDRKRFLEGAGPFGDQQGRRLWQAMTAADRSLVDQAFAAVGKLIAAYEETLLPATTRFDRFAAALSDGEVERVNEILSAAEQRGLELFIDDGRTRCLRCHNGPLFTNYGFHAIGSEAGPFDLGFFLGLQAAQVDRFNCTGAYSDDRSSCPIRHMGNLELEQFAGAFKVPTLRHLEQTAPYFHDGRFESLEAVLDFYRNPPEQALQSMELTPLHLDQEETGDLLAFLRSLSPDQ